MIIKKGFRSLYTKYEYYGLKVVQKLEIFVPGVPKKATSLFENNKETGQLKSSVLPFLNC